MKYTIEKKHFDKKEKEGGDACVRSQEGRLARINNMISSKGCCVSNPKKGCSINTRNIAKQVFLE
jgi:hypothetical protein